MKKFKKADFIFQAAMVLVFTLMAIIQPSNIYMAYFVVGSVQVLSMIIHAVNSWNTRKGSRRFYYHRIVLGTLLAMALSAGIPFMFYIWYALLFTAPVMAYYYVAICYQEAFHAAKRPLELI